MIAVTLAAVLYLGSAAGAPPAGAHIHAGSGTTIVITITLPNVTSARAETMPGSTARLDRDAASGTVRPVTHEHHTPSTAPANSAAGQAERPKSPSDNTARWLGGAALVVGALGICLACLALVRRRS